MFGKIILPKHRLAEIEAERMGEAGVESEEVELARSGDGGWKDQEDQEAWKDLKASPDSQMPESLKVADLPTRLDLMQASAVSTDLGRTWRSLSESQRLRRSRLDSVKRLK